MSQTFGTYIGEGLLVIVEYETIEGQRQILYPADDAQEGIAPESEIQTVTALGYDISSALNELTMNELVRQCDKHTVAMHEAAQEYKAESAAENKAERDQFEWD